MSVIQTIRDKGAAIVIAVIALSLIGFLLMDAKSGSAKLFGGNNSTKVGTVNGRDIEYDEFSEKEKSMEQQYQSSGAAMRNQIRQNVWDQLVAEKLLEGEFEKLGLAFTPKEMSTIMFSEDAPQAMKQAFVDEQNQYDVVKAQQWWSDLKKSKDDNQLNEVKNQIIDPMRLNTLYSKFSSMIAASIYTPGWMAAADDQDTKTFANISYVSVPYSEISDSSVKVTDADITNYLEKHKAKYKQEAGRIISYVTFSASPSAQDTAQTLETVSQLKQSFIADSNAQSFVTRNGSTTSLFDGYTPKSKMQMPMKDSIIALPDGGVFGPYLDGGTYVLAKKVKTKMLPDSIKCRHILIGTQNPQNGQPLMADSVAKAKIDSVETAIRGGADFIALESAYSTDKAAHKDSGVMTFDITTIQSDGFAKEFGDFLLNENGETKKVVKTQFGWHYIEILNKKNIQPAYKVAYMAKEILPSDETSQAASANATKLSGNARDAQAFDKYVSTNGLNKITPPNVIKENDYQIGALQDARAIIRWAFDAKEGAVSEPYYIGNDYIVAVVNKKVKEGLPDAATIRPQIEQLVMNAKKAAIIKSKLASATTLEAAAAAYNKPVMQAGADSTLTFKASLINGIGNEPVVAGASFNKDYQSKISPALAGNTGVFVLKINSFGTKILNPEDAKIQMERKRSQQAQSILGQSFNALKNQADINDRRSKFF